MNPQREEAEQLLAAAQRDRTGFHILRRDAESPVEIMLFHAQQAAEPLIKTVLSLNAVAYDRMECRGDGAHRRHAQDSG